MSKVYVLYCEQWGGTHYDTEILTACTDEELAHRSALQLQQYHTPADTRFIVQEVQLEEFEP